LFYKEKDCMLPEYFIDWLDKYEKIYPSSIVKQAFED
jgi:hypothetical protein